jgi:CubicO group peptidase (beta-lactamase class C family)
MRLRLPFLRVCVLVLLLVMVAAGRAENAPPGDLDAYVARAMQTFNVPGMALAIVKDGTVVVAKGYGVRKLGDPASVDENTLFGIGSNTKAFTSAALATLVDEDKISWDNPVNDRLPGL